MASAIHYMAQETSYDIIHWIDDFKGRIILYNFHYNNNVCGDVILSSVETMCGGGVAVGGGGPLLAEVTGDLCSLVIIFLSSRELFNPATSTVKTKLTLKESIN